jgi:hypothetical protein
MAGRSYRTSRNSWISTEQTVEGPVLHHDKDFVLDDVAIVSASGAAAIGGAGAVRGEMALAGLCESHSCREKQEK